MWAKPITRKLKLNRQRDNKVTVSPSRPLNCYVAGITTFSRLCSLPPLMTYTILVVF